MTPYWILLCTSIIIALQFISKLKEDEKKDIWFRLTISIIAMISVGLSFNYQFTNNQEISNQKDSTRKYTDLLARVNKNSENNLGKSDSIINLNLKLSKTLADSAKSIINNLSNASKNIKKAISGGDGLLHIMLSTSYGENSPMWQIINPNWDIHYDVSISIIDHDALDQGDKIKIDNYYIFDVLYLDRNSSNSSFSVINKKDLINLNIPVKSSILYSKYIIKISTRNMVYYQDYIRQGTNWGYRLYKLKGNEKEILEEKSFPGKKIDNWNLHFKYTFENIKTTNLKEYKESIGKKRPPIQIIPNREF